MQVVLPVAGFGSRMRPQTWSKPKPLLHVAGNTVLGHTLDKLADLKVDEVVFITGWMGEQIQDWVERRYSFKTRYVVQHQLEGQAHAIYLAREYLSGPCLVIFVDTIFEADLSRLNTATEDGVIFVQEVEDPRDFGIVVEREGRVVQYVEKPTTLDNRKTTVGVFWFRESQALISAIRHMLDNNIRTKGEYYLADAVNVMLERGARFVSQPVSLWEDCGQPDTILKTNRTLLARGRNAVYSQGTNCVIIPPVYIAPGVQMENAVIGPDVSIDEGATIRSSIVRDSIIEAGARLENSLLEGSLIGRRALVRGHYHQLNIGDNSTVGQPDQD
ncbi:MAG: sugar phosphate nucleotidyltransferase [Anaerolineae bacterium]|jgi:glucose-1-phosphate thymidylyltransferase|nr:NTP transferase domain-containing protein [Chloroflexota bacterium]